jgi:hypothetical protein
MVQTGYGAHPAPYPMVTRGSLSGGEAATSAEVQPQVQLSLTLPKCGNYGSQLLTTGSILITTVGIVVTIVTEVNTGTNLLSLWNVQTVFLDVPSEMGVRRSHTMARSSKGSGCSCTVTGWE